METSTAIRVALAALAIGIPTFYMQHTASVKSRRRDKNLTHENERVLIIGASSGVGRAVARQYAARGARVCVVARRTVEVMTLAKDCGINCIWEIADFSNADDMVRVRTRLESEWHGLDTIHICAGVSALQPVMSLTGIKSAQEDADISGIQGAVDVAERAMKGNFNGPLVSALTFVC